MDDLLDPNENPAAAGGVLPIHKPKGPTSHDMVLLARRSFAPLPVGHTGTLDPSASGVLVLLIGAATRFSAYFDAWDKSYLATVQFGVATDSDDAAGNETERREVSLSREELEAVLHLFKGDILQVPPAYAALKKEGKKLYEYARAGKKVAASPRRVRIHRITLEAYEEGAFPQASLQVDCGKGTYIRALARDLGGALGLPAHLKQLVRTRAGPFTLEEAVALAEEARPNPLSVRRAFAGWQELQLHDDDVQLLYHGKSLPLEAEGDQDGEGFLVLIWRGVVVGVGRADRPRAVLRPARLIPKAIAFRLAGEAS